MLDKEKPRLKTEYNELSAKQQLRALFLMDTGIGDVEAIELAQKE